MLNEGLAARCGPQIGKGVGIIGKTLIAHVSVELKETFLPTILENDVEFTVGYSEPDAGSDAASIRFRAARITSIQAMGDERTNEVWFDEVFVPDSHLVGEMNHGFRYISQPLDLERFTMFTFAPIKQRMALLHTEDPPTKGYSESTYRYRRSTPSAAASRRFRETSSPDVASGILPDYGSNDNPWDRRQKRWHP